MDRSWFAVLAGGLLALAAQGRVLFEVEASPELAGAAKAGRLLIMMSEAKEGREMLAPGFVPGETWVVGDTVLRLPAVIDPDRRAYPKPFSQAAPGRWQVMALLDSESNYNYHGPDTGDYLSAVVTLEGFDPGKRDEPVKLILTRKGKARREVQQTPGVVLVEMESRLLTEFLGRPATVRAGVVLPPDYETTGNGRHYPTAYHIHGFGGDHQVAWFRGPELIEAMRSGKRAPMVHVFLDGSCPGGHHEFADSLNNGPWGKALTEEFIPHLEQRFRLLAKPHARFVTGHSSGGWSSLWLQVTYPDFFGGTWSTAPDPVDFRAFTGVNATLGSRDNAYVDTAGKERNLVRDEGKELATFRQFTMQEEAISPYGGQIASFDWVFSPRGLDGRPMPLFNRETGEVNPEVTAAWQKYDIRLVLQRNWEKLGPKLKGKLTVICGTEDTFHLEEGVRYLCDFLKEMGADSKCELVPGRDHGDLYKPEPTYFPNGLEERIDREMTERFQAGEKKQQ